MSLDTDLQSKLTLLVGASVPVQQNYVERSAGEPRVWYQRQAGTVDLLARGDDAALRETTFAVEVAGLDIDAAAAVYETLVALHPSGLQGFRGTLAGPGSTRVLGCFLEDLSDDYQPRSLELDDGFHVFSFQARIMT